MPAHKQMDTDSLADWLARCALGDQEALSRLYQSTAPKLFAIAIRIVKRQDLAEEILQESFVRIWQHAGDYHIDRGSAMTWMASIVRHRALDVLRKPDYERPLSGDTNTEPWRDDNPGAIERWIHSMEARALRDCLEQLDKQQRQSITLAFFYGLTHAELADRMQQPLGSIKSWIRRGLKRLRRCLEP